MSVPGQGSAASEPQTPTGEPAAASAPASGPATELLERRAGLWLLALSVVLGAALRIQLALTDDGIFWPDEIFQSFEPAHRAVFGYGLIPWEFIDGARNWTLPGIVALLLKLCALLGLDQPAFYVRAVKVFFGLTGALTAWAVYVLARAHNVKELPSAVGAALFALAGPMIYFGPRVMSETACALPVAAGFALALRRNPRITLGASLVGLGVLLRLQAGVFALGLVIILLRRRQWKNAARATWTLTVWALVFGAMDRLTWGGWFHSAVQYVNFNLIEGKASGWGTAPWSFYAEHLYRSMPLVTLALLVLSLLAVRRAWGLFIAAFGFIVLHAFVPHKELRFVLPALPLVCALAGIGLAQLPRRFTRSAAAAVVVVALVSGLGVSRLTFGDLGQYPERPQASALDDFGPVNRLLLAAHEQADLCGLRIDVAHLAWTGGHTYLHRRVPLYHLGQPPFSAGTFNYVLAAVGPAYPGEVIARDVRNPAIALVRLSPGPCKPDLSYSWRLP